MEKITITISDNLSPEQEVFAIAKKLGKALGPLRNLLALGDGYEVKQLDTQIIIKRVPSSPLLITQTCSVCDTIFEPKVGVSMYVNYGGIVQKRRYCCEDCKNVVKDMCGPGRAVDKKKDLKFSWFR